MTAMAVVLGGPSSDQTLPDVRQAGDHNEAAVQYAQLVIQRRTIIRVPPVYVTTPRPTTAVVWKEKNAAKCVSMSALAGLAITRPDAVDLVLRGGQRVRAKLEKSCPSVDFYSGFYVKPHKDGRICEDRDTIHSRTGGACVIDKFKSLVAVKPSNK